MNHLKELESFSIYILREAYNQFPKLCMLWSIGKDSTVLLWLARKAFFSHVPFPLVHIDTSFKIPEMIEYRDKLAMDLGIEMIVGKNTKAIDAKHTFPDGSISRIECCRLLKTEALINTIKGNWPRYLLDHKTGTYKLDEKGEGFNGVIVGLRADEEGSRSKERYFSARNTTSKWDINNQPPEFWNQFKTDFAPGTHIRIHPLLDWSEVDVWEYIHQEGIPVVSLYFDKGSGKRYRSLGCWPCTDQIKSSASNAEEIIQELRTGKLANIAERAERKQDEEDGGGLEVLRKNGYM